VQAVRALVVTAVFLAIAGIAFAAAPRPTTILHSPSAVEAVAQDGGLLAWLTGNKKKCNAVHIAGASKTSLLPQPPNGSMTCRWNLTAGAQQLAIASGASAALWTLHEPRTDFIVTAQVGGKEVKLDRLAHQSDGTHLWLGAIAGSGTTLVYSWVDVEYVDPIACASGGSCTKKIADGGVELVSAGQKTSLPHALPALGLAISDGHIAYVPATAVAKSGKPGSAPGTEIPIADASTGTVLSQASPSGVPVAVGLSSHVLAVLSRAAGKEKLMWFDAATGVALGAVTVPSTTLPQLAMDDQVVVFRVGRFLHALAISTGREHVVAKMAAGATGLSLDAGRLVWAESGRTSGRIRGLSVG